MWFLSNINKLQNKILIIQVRRSNKVTLFKSKIRIWKKYYFIKNQKFRYRKKKLESRKQKYIIGKKNWGKF